MPSAPKTLKEVLSRIEALKKAAEEFKRKERPKVIEHMRGTAQVYGITPEEVFGKPVTRTPEVAKKVKQIKKSIPRVEKLLATNGAPLKHAVKYTDGDNHWTGFGPRPKWMREALAAGKTLDELKA